MNRISHDFFLFREIEISKVFGFLNPIDAGIIIVRKKNQIDISRSDRQLTFILHFLPQEYGRNLAELGVAAADIPAYRSLWQCVAPTDRQAAIDF